MAISTAGKTFPAHRAYRGAGRPHWRRRASRRSGQALLLAVLLMVFAALLGSTFITIVSSNLNHTARQGEVASSSQSAQAGLSFVNDRLTNSAQGQGWRPWQVLGSPPPKPGDSGFDFYYTPLERAKGWVNEVDFSNVPPGSDLNANGITYANAIATNNDPEVQAELALWVESQMVGSPPKRCFVKFPDPRGPATNAGSPLYLAEVRPEVKSGARTGGLEICVIGQSEENPNAFEVRRARKGGAPQSPLLASARTVTNWDFSGGTVPEAEVASIAGSDLNIANRRGSFPAAPFYVTVGGVNTPLQTAVVSQVNSPTQLRLTAPITAVAGDRVQIAAPLGAPSGVDYDADGATQGAATDASGRRVLYGREAVAFSPAENPGPSTCTAATVNGGLVWMGNALLKNRSNVRASGLVALRDVPSGPRALPRAVGLAGTNARLTGSGDASFPIFQGVDENGAAIDQAAAKELVRDGLGRLRNTPNTLRNVTDFTPPNIDGEASAGRYRELSKFSAPNVNITDYGSNTAGGPGALYGYGEGLYIDNAEDRERLSLSTGATRQMTQAELRQMIFGAATSTSASLANSFQRACRPYGVGQRSGTAIIPTLEQKHVRGWIGPDEFRGRGALIELAPGERYFATGPNDDRTIYVTLDALSDGGPVGDGTNAHQPDPKKSYRLADGSLPADAMRYKRRLPWPQNGVVFAEGNVRLKGGAFNAAGRADASVDPHRGLTIVTMGNAYIDGSLNAGARKIAILAKENVILNPTALVSRVEAQTRVRSRAGTPLGSVVEVDDGTLFQVGDWVEIGTNAGPFRVTSTSAATVGLSPAYTGTAVTPILRATQDPLFGSGANSIPYFGNALRIARPSDIAQRRFPHAAGARSVRLTLRHSALRRPAFQVRADRSAVLPTAPTAIDLSSKMISSADLQSGIIPAADKYLRVEHNSPVTVPGADVFSNVAPSDGADLRTSMRLRLGVAGATDGLEKQFEDASLAHVAQGWAYNTADTQPLGSFDSNGGGASPLWFFLAASSNRHSFGYATGEALRRKQSLLGATPASLPVGVSIAAFVNAAPSPAEITSDHFNPATRAFDEKLFQFGFSHQLDAPEDALTIDETFYTGFVGTGSVAPPDADAEPNQINLNLDTTDYTLDSRSFDIASTSASGQNTFSMLLNPQPVRASAAPASSTGIVADDFFLKARAKMPYYRLSRLKLDTQDASGAPAFDSSSGQLAKIEPGATMDVHAFVYAQQGSWMVVAGDFYDSNLQTDAGGLFVTRANGSRANADLNRDGVVTREEKTAAYRLRRYNYKVNFRGAIAENQALPPVAETTVPGAVADWMDKWATFRFAASAGDFDDAQRDGIAASSATARLSQAQSPLSDANAGANFGSISYEFDPTMSSPATLADTGFRPPVTPELSYTE